MIQLKNPTGYETWTIANKNSFKWSLHGLPNVYKGIIIFVISAATLWLLTKLCQSYNKYARLENDDYQNRIKYVTHIKYLHYLYGVVLILNLIFQLLLNLEVLLYLMIYIANLGIVFQLVLVYQQRSYNKIQGMRFWKYLKTILAILFIFGLSPLLYPDKCENVTFCNAHSSYILTFGQQLFLTIFISVYLLMLAHVKFSNYYFQMDPILIK